MASTRSLPPNVHLLGLYKTDQSMFELDGRHFKSYVGKDYLDHLFAQAESGMVQVSLDADERLAADQNRITSVESRVDLVKRDLGRSEQRINVVVARAAEDRDAAVNEK